MMQTFFGGYCNFHTNKFHQLRHAALSIPFFGAPMQWDGRRWEMAHKSFIKYAYTRTTRIGDIRHQMMDIFQNSRMRLYTLLALLFYLIILTVHTTCILAGYT